MALLVALLSLVLHQGSAPPPSLVSLPSYGEQAAWSSDSSRLAVPAPDSIAVLDGSGRVEARIGGVSPVDQISESCLAPLAWSAADTRLLFVGPEPAREQRCLVGEVGLGSGGPARTRRLGAVSGADWSRGGWPLVYVKESRTARREESSLWLLDRLGGQPRRIAAQRGEISQATVSDDGSAIAYLSRGEGNDPWVSVWKATGGKRRKVAANLLVFWIDWSPDHHWLAAVAVPRAGPRHNQLLLLGPNRERRVLVSDDVGTGAGSWSPDGESVTYASESGKIRSVDIDSGLSDDLAQLDERIVTSLLWAPNGKVVAFTAQLDRGSD
jgi:dipeptidyl aminopeptidase/acylaminoacyl peptidase